MAGRILNFDKVVTEIVTVAINGGPTWELRDDVPAGTMAMAFRVFDLEREMVELAQAEAPITIEDERRLLDENEVATLDAVTAIVRHSYPEVTREQVAEALTPAQRGAVLQVFFPLLLRRFGKLSPSSSNGAQPTTEEQTIQEERGAARKAGTGTTTSRKR